jgi:hypothetical protein
VRVLVVGAGAVGQVYGQHLALGGARVSVLVRPRYAEDAERGFELVHIHSKRRRIPARFVPAEVLTSDTEVAAGAFDQIWHAVPTPPLARGELDGVLAASGAATIVSLQPGVTVAAHLERFVEPHRIVYGIIGFQSYAAPLEGSADAIEKATGPGIAYFFPPFIHSQFSGIEWRLRSVLDALHMGRLPSVAITDAHLALAFSSAMLMPIVSALERAGWSLAAMREGDGPSLAARAAAEAMAIIAAETGSPRPPYAALLRGPLIRLGLGFAARVTPFDLEAFFHVHFAKVGAQTRAMLDEYVRIARERSATSPDEPLEHDAIDELRAALAKTAAR